MRGLDRIKRIILCFCLFGVSIVQAQDLIPLDEYLSSDRDNLTKMSYWSKMCSANYNILGQIINQDMEKAARLSGKPVEEIEEMFNKLVLLSANFLEAATMLDSKAQGNNLEEQTPITFKELNKIIRQKNKIISSHQEKYDRNPKSFDDEVDTCTKLLTALLNYAE